MSLFYIAEYENCVFDARGESVLAPEEPAILDQPPINFTDGQSHPSQPFNSKTRFVMIHTDAVCSYVVGTGTPQATTSNKRMGVGETRFFGVKPGATLSLAVILNT